MNSINCNGKLINLEEPVVMGIINATPDSFYEGHLPLNNEEILMLATKMIAEGATLLDIGGMSTKPGSTAISGQEEMDRVLPVIELLKKTFPETILSIDTYRSNVAKAAVEAGATIVNDISGANMDNEMLSAVAKLNVPYICMHMKGTPYNMQVSPVYENVVKEVLDFFIQKKEQCKKAGIKDIIFDPGFGFGKTAQHNFQLLKNLSLLCLPENPLLVGLSRKSTIYKTLNISAAEALNGTTVLNTIALLNGACILRVHDVKEAKEAILLYKEYKKAP